MILANIKWIFFDIGSTLVDESVAYQNRIERTIAGTNVTYDDFYNKMVEISKYNQSGYNKALEAYGLKTVPWNSNDEFVYPETENCLSELSKHYKIGIIANQNLGSEERLEKLGLLKHIDLVIILLLLLPRRVSQSPICESSNLLSTVRIASPKKQ